RGYTTKTRGSDLPMASPPNSVSNNVEPADRIENNTAMMSYDEVRRCFGQFSTTKPTPVCVAKIPSRLRCDLLRDPLGWGWKLSTVFLREINTDQHRLRSRSEDNIIRYGQRV